MEKVTAAMIEAGGFRTLDDGRVVYIENTRSDSPGDMLGAVYESLEGRKSWGTLSRGDFDVAAASAAIDNDPQEVAALVAKMQAAAKAGLTDEDALASMLAAAWIGGAEKVDSVEARDGFATLFRKDGSPYVAFIGDDDKDTGEDVKEEDD